MPIFLDLDLIVSNRLHLIFATYTKDERVELCTTNVNHFFAVGEMSGKGGFAPGLSHHLSMRGSPTGGPRPLLGMPFAGRARGSYRGRPMVPRGGQMHPRFQRPPHGQFPGNEVNIFAIITHSYNLFVNILAFCQVIF